MRGLLVYRKEPYVKWSKTQVTISFDAFLEVFPKDTELLLKERLGSPKANKFCCCILFSNHLLSLAMGVVHGLEVTELSLSKEVGGSHPIEQLASAQ